MSSEPLCPKCKCDYVYAEGALWVCPECSYEWTQAQPKAAPEAATAQKGVCDAHGNELKTGDAVTVIKDLKIKGSSSVVKVGTKVKNIRIVDSDDGHNIACKIDGLGAINLKSEFVKKV